ncbi:MAG TPA: class I SAM-dependent methyltransferase [Pyrinomonadaceae bacterium]|nr:class I SAM-dependent methyltransferase [Pyrinomonadaceae bacterium]
MMKPTLLLHKLWRRVPESFKGRLKGFYPVITLRTWLARRRWQGATHDEIYDQEYFHFVDRTTKQSAEVIADSLVRAFQPATVIDVGCGTGALLDSLRARGVAVRGLEYAQAALEFCWARKLEVLKFDVESDPFPDSMKADLVISMEVGHQLPQASAGRYVDLLCSTAPLVVFSSEIPGGGDKLPRNERQHTYWIEKFEERGYRFEEGRALQWRKEWKERGTASWFSRNVMIFARCEN